MLQSNYLLIHTPESEYGPKVILGGDGKSELCISEVLAKKVLVSALAKKLSSFLKTKALLALFFNIFLWGMVGCNFYCTANIFTINFFYVYSHTKITWSLSLCTFCVWITQSYFCVLWIRKLSLGRSDGNSPLLQCMFHLPFEKFSLRNC